jgi:hypothetical protein
LGRKSGRIDASAQTAESLLDALEQSRRVFEKHRELVLGQLKRRPSA